jgi:predicted exporter
MTTAIEPSHQSPEPDRSAQSLMLWMAVALLAVTALIVVGITLLSTTAGMVVAYGSVLVGTIIVFGYISRFIGPEDEDH